MFKSDIVSEFNEISENLTRFILQLKSIEALLSKHAMTS
jgi:hypothetical protein